MDKYVHLVPYGYNAHMEQVYLMPDTLEALKIGLRLYHNLGNEEVTALIEKVQKTARTERDAWITEVTKGRKERNKEMTNGKG